ncbi:MAG TPA: PEGA domain-containing protein [Vicinamibacterales bacterium]|nr:PEGA domain-containing protein [Vicinamibacterales bacterium]
MPDGNGDRGDRSARVPDGNRNRGSIGGASDRGGRVRGDNSRVAIPRQGPPPQRRDGRNVYRNYGGRNIYIVPRGRTYSYYPRYYYRPYSFGYGPSGRGHFYFDLHYNSYIWHPGSVYRYDSYSYGYPVGELRLKVHPRDAQVFIDGYYAGRVDDFDGVFQSLRLEDGDYQVEIVLPGYEPLAFDVRIFPGEKTTYEGDLLPEQP